MHGEGRAARAALEQARSEIAEALGASTAGIVFTSGATEANALALRQTQGGCLTSMIEHPSVLEARDAERVPLRDDGRLDLTALDARLARRDISLVSVVLACNETGIVQPVEEIAHIAHRHGALFHTDAAQALGRMPLDIRKLGVDMLTISAHKIGGPKGVGALVLRDGLEVAAGIKGGGQERHRRSGTENVAGAMGFAAALRAIAADEAEHIAGLRDRLESQIDADVVSATFRPRLCNTVALACPGADAAVLVMRLDLEGFAVGAGSACSSGKTHRSPIFSALGLSREIARSTIRVSLGWNTTRQEVDDFALCWRSIHATLGGENAAATSMSPQAKLC